MLFLPAYILQGSPIRKPYRFLKVYPFLMIPSLGFDALCILLSNKLELYMLFILRSTSCLRSREELSAILGTKLFVDIKLMLSQTCIDIQCKNPMFQSWYPAFPTMYLNIWVWVKIRYPNYWMVNTKLD